VRAGVEAPERLHGGRALCCCPKFRGLAWRWCFRKLLRVLQPPWDCYSPLGQFGVFA
jgi:hypothetical protein